MFVRPCRICAVVFPEARDGEGNSIAHVRQIAPRETALKEDASHAVTGILPPPVRRGREQDQTEYVSAAASWPPPLAVSLRCDRGLIWIADKGHPPRPPARP